MSNFPFNFLTTGDIFGTVLSLYMHDTSQSLPTSEEVLICTSDTTAEEVSIEKFRHIFSQLQVFWLKKVFKKYGIIDQIFFTVDLKTLFKV